MFDTVPKDPPSFSIDGSPGLFLRHIRGQEQPILSNIRERPAGRPGSILINVATTLLFALAIGLFIVSLRAQYTYVFSVKHASAVSMVEAVALDLGMSIFSLLALGLARAGKPAKIERGLVLVSALGSAAMNWAAADVASPRSVAAYVMPPLFLALVVDRVVAVIRRHILADDFGGSPWRVAGKVALYGLRTIVAPISTIRGGRLALLNATPVPEPAPKPIVIDAEPVDAEIVEPAELTTSEPPAILMRQVGPIESVKRTTRPRKQARRPKSFASGKTAKFLAECAEKFGGGQLGGIDLGDVYRISKELAPSHDLHPGSARSALRKAILAASEVTQ